MVFTLSTGQAIHLAEGITLTVLAVDGDLIHFGLETPEGTSPDAGEVGQAGEEFGLTHRRNRWELN